METFVLRVRDSDPSVVPVADQGPCGVIRHVRTGREMPFSSWEELRGILSSPTVASSGRPSAVGREARGTR